MSHAKPKTAVAMVPVGLLHNKNLRYWDRQGKFKPIRRPFNGYRLYPQDNLDSLLETTAVDDAERLAN